VQTPASGISSGEAAISEPLRASASGATNVPPVAVTAIRPSASRRVIADMSDMAFSVFILQQSDLSPD
jgi:hypothetical protein